MHLKLPLAALASALLLMGCNSRKEPASREPQQFEHKNGETVTSVATAPHQWRNDPDCFAKGTKIDPSDPFPLRAASVKWRNPRRLHGYLYTTFEGWNFVVADRRESSEGLGEGRYQTEIYATGDEIPLAPEPHSYWIEFIGREALCNSQSPDDATFALSLSPNLVKIDKIQKLQRVR